MTHHTTLAEDIAEARAILREVKPDKVPYRVYAMLATMIKELERQLEIQEVLRDEIDSLNKQLEKYR